MQGPKNDQIEKKPQKSQKGQEGNLESTTTTTPGPDERTTVPTGTPTL